MLRYDRLCRTAASESLLLSDDEQPLGRLELHYAQSLTYGLLVLEAEPAPAALRELIERIDEDLVCTAGTARHDFVLTVYVGTEIGVYDDARRAREAWAAGSEAGG